MGAVIVGQQLPNDISAASVQFYPNITKALTAVNRGEADYDPCDICMALARPVDLDLLTILNKSINSLSAAEKQLYKTVI